MSADTGVIAINDSDREAARFFTRWLTGANTLGNLRFAFARHRTEAQAELVQALADLRPILDRAESNASGNPEWEVVSARINAAHAALAKAASK